MDEEALLVAAEKEPADVFGHTVRDHVNERSAGENLEARCRRQRARREANIKQESDGMYKLFGTFDLVAGARIETTLAAMAKKLRRGEDVKNRATPAQRYADALELLITRRGAGKPQGTNLVTRRPTRPRPRRPLPPRTPLQPATPWIPQPQRRTRPIRPQDRHRRRPPNRQPTPPTLRAPRPGCSTDLAPTGPPREGGDMVRCIQGTVDTWSTTMSVSG